MKSRQVREILESTKPQDQGVDELYKKLTFQLNNKQWHEFGESILELVFKNRTFNYSELIHAVFQ